MKTRLDSIAGCIIVLVATAVFDANDVRWSICGIESNL